MDTHPLTHPIPTPADGRTSGSAGAREDEVVVWQRPWMATFITAMRSMPNPTQAARLAGVGHSTVYEWRERDEVFRAAWDDAREQSHDLLEYYGHQMASTGLEVAETRTTVVRQLVNGALVTVEERTQTTTSRYVSPQMAMFLLRAYRPKRFTQPARFEHSAPGGGPVQHEIHRPLDRERARELARITMELEDADVEEIEAEDAEFVPVENGHGGIVVE